MKKIYSLTLFLALYILSSCSFLDVKPINISKETFYNNQVELEYGLSAIYGTMASEAFYGNHYSVSMNAGDDLGYFNRPWNNDLAKNTQSAGTKELNDIWNRIYAGIRNANAYMKAIENSEYDKNHKYYAEARFLRAYYFFILGQTWGNVPLRTEEVLSKEEIKISATPQDEVLLWVLKEMEATVDLIGDDIKEQPSRVTKTTAQAIIARVALFMAGESISSSKIDKNAMLKKAKENTLAVIKSNKHKLNPSYAKVFQNYIADTYDKEYFESMWEVEFKGDRSTSDNWTNGRIGDVIGLQSTEGKIFKNNKANFSYALYNATLKLWDLYVEQDRIVSEKGDLKDVRCDWNIPPYNYRGDKKLPPYGLTSGAPAKNSVDKTPYVYNGKNTTVDPKNAPGGRNFGKFRREVEYEGLKLSKRLYTTINFPILRYSDVLLMFAEASNELDGLNAEAYDAVKQVRDRAKVGTKAMSEYTKESFREFIRNERGRELCFEALRRYDLIRWGIYVQTMNEAASKWKNDPRWKGVAANQAAEIGARIQEKHILMPIPLVELGSNTYLRQNPSW